MIRKYACLAAVLLLGSVLATVIASLVDAKFPNPLMKISYNVFYMLRGAVMWLMTRSLVVPSEEQRMRLKEQSRVQPTRLRISLWCQLPKEIKFIASGIYLSEGELKIDTLLMPYVESVAFNLPSLTRVVMVESRGGDCFWLRHLSPFFRSKIVIKEGRITACEPVLNDLIGQKVKIQPTRNGFLLIGCDATGQPAELQTETIGYLARWFDYIFELSPQDT